MPGWYCRREGVPIRARADMCSRRWRRQTMRVRREGLLPICVRATAVSSGVAAPRVAAVQMCRDRDQPMHRLPPVDPPSESVDGHLQVGWRMAGTWPCHRAGRLRDGGWPGSPVLALLGRYAGRRLASLPRRQDKFLSLPLDSIRRDLTITPIASCRRQ